MAERQSGSRGGGGVIVFDVEPGRPLPPWWTFTRPDWRAWVPEEILFASSMWLWQIPAVPGFDMTQYWAEVDFGAPRADRPEILRSQWHSFDFATAGTWRDVVYRVFAKAWPIEHAYGRFDGDGPQPLSNVDVWWLQTDDGFTRTDDAMYRIAMFRSDKIDGFLEVRWPDTAEPKRWGAKALTKDDQGRYVRRVFEWGFVK